MYGNSVASFSLRHRSLLKGKEGATHHVVATSSHLHVDCFPISYSIFCLYICSFIIKPPRECWVSFDTQQPRKIVHPQITSDDDFWGCGVFLHIYHPVFSRVVCWNAMMNTSSLKHCRFRYSSRCRDKCPPPMHPGLHLLHSYTSNWWRPSAPWFWMGSEIIRGLNGPVCLFGVTLSFLDFSIIRTKVTVFRPKCHSWLTIILWQFPEKLPD